MELKLYPKLSTNSKRALRRQKKEWGHPYHYEPRLKLLKRLSQETGMSLTEVRNQLINWCLD